jgi:hypothetical protein
MVVVITRHTKIAVTTKLVTNNMLAKTMDIAVEINAIIITFKWE